jgi:hypothetical protein
MHRQALDLIASYLLERKQRVKLRGCTSDWTAVDKGVPQGSVLGPMLFNFFLNDIFLSFDLSELFNYADDNTILAICKDILSIKKIIAKEASMAIKWFQINLMEANPEKFQFTLLGKNVCPETESLEFSDVKIECESEVKLLGVTLDYKLSFNTHTNNLASKAGAQLSALTRIKRYLDEGCKITLTKTFITSHFRYCPVVWHFCGQGNTEKLENIQKRSLSLALNQPNNDYGALLKKANLTTLELTRQKCILIEVYKSVNNLNPNYLNNLFQKVNISHFTRNSVNGLCIPTTKTVSYGSHSVKHFGAILWNNLPSDIQTAENLNIFKERLTTWQGAACRCAKCKN